MHKTTRYTKKEFGLSYAKPRVLSHIPGLYYQDINSIASASVPLPDSLTEKDGKFFEHVGAHECLHLLGRTKEGCGVFCGRPVAPKKTKCDAHLKL